MPDEEKKQPAQQPTERITERRDYSEHRNVATDGEVLKASGARPSPPSPDPTPEPSEPINKAADLTEVRHFSVQNDGDSRPTEQGTTPPPPPPPPPPASESDDGGV